MIQNEWMTSRDSSSISTVLADRQVQRRELGLHDEPSAPSSETWRLDAGRVDVLVDVVEVPRPLLADDLDLDVDVVLGVRCSIRPGRAP